jgi:uncharacterized protein (TIGR00730 family)
MPKSICVFAGSSCGANPQYTQAARELGEELVARNRGLVYGGARAGLMAVVADTVLEASGTVTGVIPEFLVKKEVAHTGLSDLRVVGSMHERKALMVELADGFVALPGGYGTIDPLLKTAE